MTLFTTSRPTISVKSVTRYPTRITTGTGLSYTYTNGTLNISLDYSDIPDSAQIADPANYTTIVYNKTTGLLEEVQLDYIPTTVVTDPVYTRGDSNFTIPSDYRVLSLVANLTASRTWTLPLAADVTSGNRIFIYDTVGGISATNTLVIAAPSGNTINGASSITLSNAFAGITIVSNSGTQWTAILTNVDSVGGLGTNVANAMKQPVNAANGLVRLDSSGNVPALNGAALTSLNASNIGSGTVPAARLPGPTLSTIGGVKAKAAETSKFVNQIDTDGSVNLAQPAVGDISGFGTGVATALGVNVGSSGAFVTNGGALGTPSSGTLTNATGLPISTGVSGLGTGVATFLATPSSANLASAVTDETGTGALVFANSPTLVTPALGTPASGNLANCTFPTLNQNTTGTAAGLSATLVAGSGGTGQSSYTIGDILYASANNALSKLAGVATGNALISGGVGTAPSWGKVGISTHVSGLGTNVATALGNAVNGASGICVQDASGNLGLGVTPSAWAASVRAIELGKIGCGIFGSTSNTNTNLTSNSYFDTAWRYGQTGNAARFVVENSGSYLWFTAPSGAAGSTISFTQAMTLDASSNLSVVGTVTTKALSISDTSSALLRIAGGSKELLQFGPISGITSTQFGCGALDSALGSSVSFNSNGTTQFYYGTSGNEAARIDASGNLLVGTTSATGRLTVKTAANGSSGDFWGVNITNSSNTIIFGVANNGSFYTGGAASSPYNNTTASAANVFVDSDNGLLKRSTSSRRYKTNIVDAVHGLADLQKLRSVTYTGINDGDKVFGGLIAEEVDDAGLTEFVVYDDEGRPDALHYGNMAGLFVKAIQELAAKVSALEAKQ